MNYIHDASESQWLAVLASMNLNLLHLSAYSGNGNGLQTEPFKCNDLLPGGDKRVDRSISTAKATSWMAGVEIPAGNRFVSTAQCADQVWGPPNE
jgi:hypothetical protein